ncbi:MAG TPA: glycosyltransferase [Fibrobacteria bacterium]|nr:glycosyltransferase [Fibrobacteria bacterium]
MPEKIHLIAPSAPPKVCGVGDHSHLLGQALALRTEVSVHCGQTDPPAALSPLAHRVDFDFRSSRSLVRLARSEGFRKGESIFFQYTNFAYGRYGFNPWLAPALSIWKRRGLKIATMFHETYTDQPGAKGAAMRFWQRIIFTQVGRTSDLCMFSVEPWTRTYRHWFPKARVETLAVGSNIPPVATDRATHRLQLGLPEGIPVLGVFGGTHPSRLFEWIVAASRHLQASGIEHRVLRIGPNQQEVKERLMGSPLVDLGILDAEAVSKALSCCDLFLSPISDGASSRRGSLLAGLGHGLPCITTIGASSDDLFRAAADKAFLQAGNEEEFARLVADLVGDHQRREMLGASARTFHDTNFAWSAIADRFLSLIR